MLKPRLYQQTIFATAVKKNTLVVLPTGLGKTAIAVMLAIQRLKVYPKSKVLFLAPTKPLAQQHIRSFEEISNIKEIALFTGAIAPSKRKELWVNARVVVATPQGIENDLLAQRLSLQNVSVLIFDEAHHAMGDYSYNFIAKNYMQKARYPRILGLTASPGSDKEKVKEICNNLYISAVEVRSYDDRDVKDYVQVTEVEHVEVELPESFRNLLKLLNDCYTAKLLKIKSYGYTNNVKMHKGELLKLQGELVSNIASGNKDFAILKSISLVAQAIKLSHAIELIETQGIEPLHNFLQKVQVEARQGKSKASKNLASDVLFREAQTVTQKLHEAQVVHPKIIKLQEIVKSEKSKMIVFTQFRDTASEIVSYLDRVKSSRLFVGQAKKNLTGMSQKEQKEVIEAFRKNEFSVLVCTSVGEEGLDIPAVDHVIFYEPLPSAIRHIQRRGRTGRHSVGKVTVLCSKGTRDISYRYVARNRERKMNRVLNELKDSFEIGSQAKLQSFGSKPNVTIVADFREKGSKVMKKLFDMGVDLKVERLEVADYLCSGECGIEFKSVKDFVNSILDGRFLEQLKKLKESFAKPLVIIEGEEDIYAVRKVHPNAILGMIASVTVSYKIPLVRTKNAQETAGLLLTIAKREQDKARDVSVHYQKPVTIKEQQEYIVSSLPGIGINLARELLKHFGSVKGLADANVKELVEIEGVGEIMARRIFDVFNKSYSSRDKSS